MRPVIVAANWKMHTTAADAAALAAAIAAASSHPDVIRVICPPFLSLAAVRDAVAGTGIAVGAQNVHHELAGAFTGETSAPMLAGLATWVIVGHSERRRDAGETDALINRKLARALDSGLRPILCVGELLADRDLGRAEDVVGGQVRACLAGLDADALAAGGLVVAYEPVWAIGTGRNARGADAAAMADAIRRVVADVATWKFAQSLPILYGGSVTGANIAEFMGEPAVDGALVGGASLKPDEMAAIVSRAAVSAAARAAARAE